MAGSNSVNEAGAVYGIGVVLQLLVHGCLPWGEPSPIRAPDAARGRPMMFELAKAMPELFRHDRVKPRSLFFRRCARRSCGLELIQTIARGVHEDGIADGERLLLGAELFA